MWNLAKKRDRRWSDDNKRFGPFTLSKSDWSKFGIGYSTHGGDYIRIHLWKYALCIEVPFSPLGRLLDDRDREINNYIEYSINLIDSGLVIYHGLQDNESIVDYNVSHYTIHFMKWKLTETRWYDDNNYLYSKVNRKEPSLFLVRLHRSNCPRRSFKYSYNGKINTVHTYFEEDEYRMNGIWPKRIVKKFIIEFDNEPEHLTYYNHDRGLTVSIDADFGDLYHIDYFKQYCDDNGLKYCGLA